MSDLQKEPEVKLWREVIKITLRDAGMNLSKGKLVNIRSARTQQQANSDRDQAINFLTATSGEWKRSRELICDLALICPDTLRSNYMRVAATNNINSL